MTLGKVGVDDPGERAARMLSCGAQKGAQAWSEKSQHGTPLYTETAAQGHGSPGSVWTPASQVEGLSGDSHTQLTRVCTRANAWQGTPPALAHSPGCPALAPVSPGLCILFLYFPVAGLWSLLSECLNN